jgi:hypothetical protein
MNGGADAFGALGWGLKKYAWLVALFVIVVGVLVPFALTRGADVYEARAQVGPTGQIKLPNLDPLPRLGESVFNNGSVEIALQQALGEQPDASVIPSRAELVTSLDNVVFTVVGRGPNPEAARHMAEVAAATFTVELNKYSSSVGLFQIQKAPDLPSKPVAKIGGPITIVLGALAGLLAGIGAVALLLVWRRPVVDAAGAADATGTPVLGRVRLGRSGDTRNVAGIAPLCRRLLGSRGDTILIASAPNATSERHELAMAITGVLSRALHVDVVQGGQGQAFARSSAVGGAAGAASPSPELLIVDGPSPDVVAMRPDSSMTLLVVRPGIGLNTLRRTAEQYLDGGPAGVVLVDRAHWYQRTHSEGARSERITEEEVKPLSEATR